MQGMLHPFYFLVNFHCKIGVYFSTLGFTAKIIMTSMLGIYTRSGLICYGVASYIVVSNYKRIADKIATLVNGDYKTNDQLSAQTRKWKEQLASVYECSDLLNPTFGFLLMIIIGSVFISVINLSFLCLINSSNITYNIYNLIDLFITLSVICLLAENIKGQVMLHYLLIFLKIVLLI